MFVVVVLFLIFVFTIAYFCIDANIVWVYYPYTISGIYWIMTIWYLMKYKKQQLFCFELLFAISFYLCSFITVFMYSYIANFQSHMYSLGVVCMKAYFISFIGYLFYLLGLTVFRRKRNECVQKYVITTAENRIANILCSILIVVFILNGGLRLLTIYSDESVSGSSRLDGFGMYLTYAIIMYILTIVTNFSVLSYKRIVSVKHILLKSDFLFIVNSIVLLSLLLLSGYRSNALQIIIPLFLAYTIFMKPVSGFKILLFLVIGALLMVFIGLTRQGEDINWNDHTILTYFRDFMPANAATQYFVNRVEIHGFTGGSNMIMSIASIIPFLQSTLGLFIDVSTFLPSSSSVFTNYYNTGSGLGTSLIGDIIYTFGFGGVMMLMFLLGGFVKTISKGKNLYLLVMYFIFIGNAIFAPRVEFCYIIRSLSWGCIFLFLVRLLSQKSVVRV